MANWSEGYKEGYWTALRKFGMSAPHAEKEIKEGIYKDADGSPSKYAVAFKCCGGIDAHSVGCRRA